MSETVIVALIGIAGTLLSPIVSSINERCKAKMSESFMPKELVLSTNLTFIAF